MCVAFIVTVCHISHNLSIAYYTLMDIILITSADGCEVLEWHWLSLVATRMCARNSQNCNF